MLANVHLRVGTQYEMSLSDGSVVTVAIFGSRAKTDGTTEWDIEVDGIRGWYASINEAVLKDGVVFVAPIRVKP